jgi:hypothetical protein
VFGDLVQYATDTEAGSSGSPVFDQQWQIVALHHRGGGLAGPDGKKYFTNEGIAISSVLRDAATFLGVPDALYSFAFSDLRSELVSLINDTHPPTDVDTLTSEVLRTLPRFSTVLDDWSKVNGKPGDSASLTLAVAGVAIGGAMRQWARTDGHESIKSVATPAIAPSDALTKLVSAFNGTDGLPSDVYAAILTGLSTDTTPVSEIVKAVGTEGLAAAAKAFMDGVSVGAKAYGPVGAPSG